MHADLPDLSMPDDAQANRAADSFRMLADPTRIKLLWALLQGESSVTCLAELAGVSPTSVSQHLAKMRLAGLVRGRREGTFVYYTAADTHVHDLLAEALFHADHLDRQRGHRTHLDGSGDLGPETDHEHHIPPARHPSTTATSPSTSTTAGTRRH